MNQLIQRQTPATAELSAISIPEEVILGGDLANLTPQQRLRYYERVCESVGLNPWTRPFEYIRLNGKLTLYARKDCADQLRRMHNVSLQIVSQDRVDDLYVVRVRATLRDGRTDEEVGAVSIAGLKGDALANALMKCITKAKRRATLSICGLGFLDETEVETIPDARPVEVDAATGEIVETTAATPRERTKDEAVADFEKVRRAAQKLGIELPDIAESVTPYQLDRYSERWSKLIRAARSNEDLKRALAEWVRLATQAQAEGLEVEALPEDAKVATVQSRSRELREQLMHRREL